MATTKVEISPRTIVFTVGFLLLLWVTYQVRAIILLVFVSFILMTAVNPIVSLARRKKIPVLPVMFLIYVGVISLLSMVIASLVPAVLDQSKSLIHNMPSYISSLQNTFNIKLDPGFGNDYLASIPSNLLRFAVGAFSNIIDVLAVFFISYYLTIERPSLHKYLVKLFTDGNAEGKAEAMIIAVERKVGGWVRGELFLMAIIGLMTYTGLVLLKIPYALPLGVLAGMLEAVPNIGPIFAAIPAILIALTISPFIALGVTALSILIQQLENNLIVPKVMQSATGTKPLVTILILLIGYTLGGIPGAVLAMPLFLTANTVYSHVNNQ